MKVCNRAVKTLCIEFVQLMDSELGVVSELIAALWLGQRVFSSGGVVGLVM